MPELREIPHKTQQLLSQGKVKLVGVGRPTKTREIFEVATPTNEPLITDEQGNLIITTTGLSAKEAKITEMAHEERQQKPRSEESRAKALFKTPARITSAVWNTLLSEPKLGRARSRSKELIEAVKNNVFTDDIIAKTRQEASDEYKKTLSDSNVMKRAGIKVQNFLRSAAGRKTTIQQLTLDKLAGLVDDTHTQRLQEQTAATAARLHEGFSQTDGAIRTAMGEEVFELTETEHQAIIKNGRTLMREYALEGLSDAEFQRRSKELWDAMKNLRPDLFKRADLYTSSLFTAAQALRTEAAQNGAIDRVQNAIDTAQFRIAFGVMGAATSIDASTAQKILGKMDGLFDRVGKYSLGALVFNEATVGSAVAYGISLAIIPRSALTSAARLIAPVGGSIVGGTVAGFRELRKLGRERRVLLRESETGKQGPAGSKRREWFERFAIDRKSATELTNALKTDDPMALAGNIAEAQARINISARRDKKGHTISLISYTSQNTIETERRDLHSAMRDARDQLKSIDQAALDAVTGGKTADEFLNDLTKLRTEELTEAMTGQQTKFKKSARRRALRYGTAAAGVGIVSSEVLADAIHFINTHQVKMVGPIGTTARGVGKLFHRDQATAAGGVAAKAAAAGKDQFEMGKTIDFKETEVKVPGLHDIIDANGVHHQLNVNIPDGTILLKVDPRGGYDLIMQKDGHTLLSGIKFDPSGKLIPPANLDVQLHSLQDQGYQMNITDHSLSPIEVGSVDNGTFNITAEQMRLETERGGVPAGPWGWMEEYATGNNPNAQTNAVKNIFRGYMREPSLGNNNAQINQIPGYHREIPFGTTADGHKEIMWEYAPKNLQVNNLPNALFSEESMRNIAKDTQEAIDFAKPLREAGMSWDEIMQKIAADPKLGQEHAILFRVGYIGGENNIPNADEIKQLMAFYGGTSTQVNLVESTVTLQQMVAQPIPPIVIPVVPHPPLTLPVEPSPLVETVSDVAPLATPTRELESGEKQRQLESGRYPAIGPGEARLGIPANIPGSPIAKTTTHEVQSESENEKVKYLRKRIENLEDRLAYVDNLSDENKRKIQRQIEKLQRELDLEQQVNTALHGRPQRKPTAEEFQQLAEPTGIWLSDVARCIRKLNKDEFTLADVYTFNEELQQLHPDNKNIEAQIRKQLQILRDRGYLEFDEASPGTYHLINLAPPPASIEKPIVRATTTLRQFIQEPLLHKEYRTELLSLIRKLSHAQTADEAKLIFEEGRKLAKIMEYQAQPQSKGETQRDQAKRLDAIVNVYLKRLETSSPAQPAQQVETENLTSRIRTAETIHINDALPREYQIILDELPQTVPPEFKEQARQSAYYFWSLNEGKQLLDAQGNSMQDRVDRFADQLSKAGFVWYAHNFNIPLHDALPTWAYTRMEKRLARPQFTKDELDIIAKAYEDYGKSHGTLTRYEGQDYYNYTEGTLPKNSPRATGGSDNFKIYVEEDNLKNFPSVVSALEALREQNIHPRQTKLFEGDSLVLYWGVLPNEQLCNTIEQTFRRFGLSTRGPGQDPHHITVKEDGTYQTKGRYSNDSSLGEIQWEEKQYDAQKFFRRYLEMTFNGAKNPTDPYKISFIPVIARGISPSTDRIQLIRPIAEKVWESDRLPVVIFDKQNPLFSPEGFETISPLPSAVPTIPETPLPSVINLGPPPPPPQKAPSPELTQPSAPSDLIPEERLEQLRSMAKMKNRFPSLKLGVEFIFADFAPRFPETTAAINQKLQALRILPKDTDPREIMDAYRTLRNAIKEQLVRTGEIDSPNLFGAMGDPILSREEMKNLTPDQKAEKIINRYAMLKDMDEHMRAYEQLSHTINTPPPPLPAKPRTGGSKPKPSSPPSSPPPPKTKQALVPPGPQTGTPDEGDDLGDRIGGFDQTLARATQHPQTDETDLETLPSSLPVEAARLPELSKPWIETIRQKGKGFLSGKFKPAWFKTEQLQQYKDEFNLNNPYEFSKVGIFGGIRADSVGAKNPTTAASAAIGTWGDQKTKNDTHYFITSQPFDKASDLGKALHLSGSGQWRAFTYLMWEHKSSTPDSRGHHIPMGLHFFLPEPEASKFAQAVKNNPDILEDVFQGMYPTLTKGLTRVNIKGVRFVDLPTNDKMTYDGRIAFAKSVTSPESSYQVKLYTRPTGEQP